MSSYGFCFTFKTALSTTTISGIGYISQGQADQGFAEALYQVGYRAPRPWQWWRWSEPKPNERVLKMFRKLSEEARA